MATAPTTSHKRTTKVVRFLHAKFPGQPESPTDNVSEKRGDMIDDDPCKASWMKKKLEE